jgi:hypothetical protein
MDCMTGGSPAEVASPAHVPLSSRRAAADPGDDDDVSSIISTTVIVRGETNLVVMAVYELCSPCWLLHPLID